MTWNVEFPQQHGVCNNMEIWRKEWENGIGKKQQQRGEGGLKKDVTLGFWTKTIC